MKTIFTQNTLKRLVKIDVQSTGYKCFPLYLLSVLTRLGSQKIIYNMSEIECKVGKVFFPYL